MKFFLIMKIYFSAIVMFYRLISTHLSFSHSIYLFKINKHKNNVINTFTETTRSGFTARNHKQ